MNLEKYLNRIHTTKCPPGYTWNSLHNKCVKSRSEEEELSTDYDVDQVGGLKQKIAQKGPPAQKTGKP